MSLMFEDTSLPAASQIKQHVFAVQEQLEKLVTVAKEVDGDEEIVTKIHVFCGEVLFNFLRKFGDSYDQLCKASGRVVPVIKAVELKQEKAESEEHSCC